MKATGASGKDIGAQPTAADGTTSMHLLDIPNPGSENVIIDGILWNPANHAAAGGGDTDLHAYLTQGDHRVEIGDWRYNYSYSSEEGAFALKSTASLANPVTLEVGDDGYWYASYDNGTTWASLGVKATVITEAKPSASTSVALSVAGAHKGTKLSVSRTKVAKAKSYRVYVAKKGAKGKLVRAKNLVKTVKASTRKATVKKLKNGAKIGKKKYKVVVKAYSKAKGAGTCLATSKTLTLVW